MSLATRAKYLDGESESPVMTPLSAELSDRGVHKQDNLRFYRWWPSSPEAVDGIPLWSDFMCEVVKAPMFTIKPNVDSGDGHTWWPEEADYTYCDYCWTRWSLTTHSRQYCKSDTPILWGF